MKKLLMIILVIPMLVSIVNAVDTVDSVENNVPQGFIDAQIEQLNPGQFDKYLEEQEKILIEESRADVLLSKIMEGKALEPHKILERIWRLILKTLTGTFRLSAVILAILLICSMIGAMEPDRSDSVSKTGQAVCATAAAIVIISVFSNSAGDVYNVIEKGVYLIRAMLPIMVVLMITSGKIVSAGSVSALLIFSTAGLNELIHAIFIPLLYGFLALGAAGCTFAMKGMDKMAMGLKSILSWGMGLLFTIFSVILTIQGSSLGIADKVAGKTIKYAIGSFIPVIGKIVSDSADMVFSCADSIHSAFGIMGIILCISYALLPGLGLVANILMCRILASISSMLGNETSAKLLGIFADGFSILLALLAISSILFIVSFAFIAVGG